MSILFGKGTLKERLTWAINMAFSHGKLLTLFVFTYKTCQCIINRLIQKNHPFVSFISGFIGAKVILRPENKNFLAINR